ncbi:hypothetical protein [Alistipes sp.]|uniref:hypothetical protein n=1 Tax=Alistipes sp. TaxID=1872444 RepID=UPI0025BFBEA5|nr:hypothetical protein [Alistipes sp.]
MDKIHFLEEKSGFVCLKYISFSSPQEYNILELYRKDAEQQEQAVQRNTLVDYQELKRQRQDNVRLKYLNENQTALMQEFLDQLTEPSVRERIFSIADALISGQLVAVSYGGRNPDSGLCWDGRRPDEEEEAYRKRWSLLYAIRTVNRPYKKSIHR